jgi:hypothetical protein
MKLTTLVAGLMSAGMLAAAAPAISADWSSIPGEGMEIGVFYQDRLESSPYQSTAMENHGLTGWQAVEAEGVELGVFYQDKLMSQPYQATSMKVDDRIGWAAIEGEGLEREIFYR